MTVAKTRNRALTAYIERSGGKWEGFYTNSDGENVRVSDWDLVALQRKLRHGHDVTKIVMLSDPKLFRNTRNPLTESYIIFDAKYQKHGAVSKDYDKLQSIADQHNENAKGAHDIWHVGSVVDFNRMVKAIKEISSKRNTVAKTRAISKRPNYKAYTHDDAMKSLLTKLSKANFNGMHTGISLAKITDEEKAAIKQFPTYFKVDRKAVYSKFPDEIESGIALFSNGKAGAIFKVGNSVRVLGQRGTHKITKLSSKHKGLYEIGGQGWIQGKDLVLISAKARPNKSEYGNDTIQKLSRTFQGKVSGTEFEVEAPEQQPERNSRLGELAKLTITKANGDEYEINFKGDAWLSADLRRNLWLSGEDSKITNIKLPPKGHLKLLGQAHFIHYLTEKKHIENNRMTEYFHEHGEVDGQRPYVYIDHEGFLHFHGGNYNIGRDGIEN